MLERVRGLWHRVRSGDDLLTFGVVVVVLGLAGGAVWFWVGAHHGGVPVASAASSGALPGLEPAERPAPTTVPSLAVHVAGAVARPGLYHLPADSRVADALGQAGGRLPGADVDRLNLAARLVDGQKVFVARRGEVAPLEAGGGSAVSPGAGGDGAPMGVTEPIDLNAADLAALDSLPGIGPATARAILEERARRGGFRSTRDLLRVPGIGEGRFARLKDRIRV